MQTFERSVLIVALLILIVTLAVMGIALKQNANKGASMPAACPDFWFSSYYQPCSMSKYGCCNDGVTPANETSANCSAAVDCNTTPFKCCPDGYTAKSTSDGANCSAQGKAMCYNVKSLPKTPLSEKCRVKNPEDFKAQFGKSSLCVKQEWAQGCNITWDGVTNVDSDCT
jgi:hypothetical protein